MSSFFRPLHLVRRSVLSLPQRHSISYYPKSKPLSFDSLSAATSLSSSVLSPSAPLPSSIRPILFVVGTSSLVFVWAALATNKDTNDQISKLTTSRSSLWRSLSSSSITSLDLAKERTKETIKGCTKLLGSLKQVGWDSRGAVLLAEAWIGMGDGQRTCAIILAANFAVFGAWQVGRCGPFMMRNFLHDPLRNRTRTLLGAVFSHKVILFPSRFKEEKQELMTFRSTEFDPFLPEFDRALLDRSSYSFVDGAI